MRSAVVFRVLGVLLTLFSVSMLVPAGVSLLYRDGATTAFLLAFAITLITGLACWLPVRKQRAELRIRDGFLVTVLFWAVLGFYGSFPLMLSDQPELSFTDAVFESLSGLTTTGATVIQGLDDLPAPSCCTASSSSGWAAWVSSSSPLPYCPCSASVACSFFALRSPAH